MEKIKPGWSVVVRLSSQRLIVM